MKLRLKDSARPVAIIWIHGWGVNFYSPAYVMIGRALAGRGYTGNHCQYTHARSWNRRRAATAEDLKLLHSSIRRHSSGPSRVQTVMIQSADHMYTGEEAQVARIIADWTDSLAPPP